MISNFLYALGYLININDIIEIKSFDLTDNNMKET